MHTGCPVDQFARELEMSTGIDGEVLVVSPSAPANGARGCYGSGYVFLGRLSRYR